MRYNNGTIQITRPVGSNDITIKVFLDETTEEVARIVMSTREFAEAITSKRDVDYTPVRYLLIDDGETSIR